VTSAPEPLVIVGAGGFGRETVEVVRAVNDAHEARCGHPRWALIGIADDDPGRWGTTIVDTPVIGPAAVVAERSSARIVVCAGSPVNRTSKLDIVARLAVEPERYATLVHPAASVSASSSLGPGTVALAGVVATAEVAIGAHVGLMPQVVLTHDDVLADFVTIGSGARLAGSVVVGTGAYLGAGCLVREGQSVGDWALVGMGAVVVDDVPAAEVWAGVPARYLRPADLPHEVLSA
jgi:sugar O-acyltransferase (sialic acid O-acetyltransferase NeuD family)